MVDLHVHSVFSDGTLTPAELIALARKTGVTAVALCDHNTVAGLPSFLAAAEGSGVAAVPGVEFSTDYRGREVHILGLFIRPEDYGAVTALLDEMLERKERSSIALCEALNKAGFSLHYAAIKAGTADGYVNRAVIAAEMVRSGVCTSVAEAFSQWLSPARGYYQPPERLNALEVIRFIKSIGAVAVLAHPFLAMEEGELRTFLKEAVCAGLDGMETMYPLFDDHTTRLAGEIADAFGLLHSGGSDFHGANKPDIRLGTGRGTLCVPEKIVTDLEHRRKETAKKH
ncbi:MAG: PHP domain-containing protein [Ruminococcaceae bacterium]|nr:PHP domain-containing protein [Oscillospiraceae bacterium]